MPEGRTAVVKDLVALEDIRDALDNVIQAFKAAPRSEESSDSRVDFDVPIVQTKKPKCLYRPDDVEEHVTARQAVSLATEPFRECLEMYGEYSWRGVVNAAYEISRSIGIDDRTWQAACDRRVLGPERTALCVILIHRNMDLPPLSKQFPRYPAACLVGLIKKAKLGKLNLLRFIYAVSRSGKELER